MSASPGVAGVKLIFGLGNPGPEYQFSPHNLGFEVIDRLAERHAARVARRQALSLCGRFEWGREEIWLIKPQTFMNLSGAAVREWLVKQNCGPGDFLILADDLDLPLGHLRIRQKGGAAGHHGLESIIGAIGSHAFTRLRIGVGPEREISDPVRYLLTPFRRSERPQVEEIIARAAEAVEAILKDGPAKAMSVYNRRRAAPGDPERPAAAERKISKVRKPE